MAEHRITDILSYVTVVLLATSGISGLAIKNPDLHKPISENKPVQRIPAADGQLHFYVLPVGQGDSHVIQCPNGDLSLIDFGSSDDDVAGFWFTEELTAFLGGAFDKIKNVVISHNHYDHYSFLPLVLTPTAGASSLTNIYVSCTYNEMVTSIKTWLTDIQAESKVRPFNGGAPCGPNDQPCGNMDLCPGDPSVVTKVLASNLENCIGDNKNIDSVVFKITHNQVTILFNGDFEDATSSQDEDGAQKALIDYYGAELQVTVYKISHHGAQNLANKRVTCAAHAPKAIFASGNTWYDGGYRHPRCDVIDRFIFEVQSLCKPLETDTASPFFCSVHPQGVLAPDDLLQQTYACGENSTSINGGFRTVTGNEYAVFTTVPTPTDINVIKFSSDGVRWGFTNNIFPKVVKEAPAGSPTKEHRKEMDECGV